MYCGSSVISTPAKAGVEILQCVDCCSQAPKGTGSMVVLKIIKIILFTSQRSVILILCGRVIHDGLNQGVAELEANFILMCEPRAKERSRT